MTQKNNINNMNNKMMMMYMAMTMCMYFGALFCIGSPLNGMGYSSG